MTLPNLRTGYTTNTVVGAASITLTKPTGGDAPVSGDLLLLIAGNENNAVDEGLGEIVSEAGWTRIYNVGDITGDNYVGAFWAFSDDIADATVVIPWLLATAEDGYGWYTVWENVNQTTPINVIDTTGITAAAPDLVVPQITTTQNGCVAISQFGFDGGDGGTFSVAGTGWVKEDQLASGTGVSNASGAFAKKDMSSLGVTGTSTWSITGGNDGVTGSSFAIAGAADPGAYLDKPHNTLLRM